MRLIRATAHAMGIDASPEAVVLVGIPATLLFCNGLFMAYAVYRMING